MNQKLNKELSARTTDDSSTKANEQHVSPAIGNNNVSGSCFSEKYELHIGESFNMETKMKDAKFKIIVSREQFQVIEQFADIEQDEELNKTYILNKCRFKVYPHFGIFN